MEKTKNISLYDDVYFFLRNFGNEENRKKFFEYIRENPEIIKDIISTKEGKDLISGLSMIEGEGGEIAISDLINVLSEVDNKDSINKIIEETVFYSSSFLQERVGACEVSPRIVINNFRVSIEGILNLLEYQSDVNSLQILQALGVDLLADIVRNFSNILVLKNDDEIGNILPQDIFKCSSGTVGERILEKVFEIDIFMYIEILKKIYNSEYKLDIILEKIEDYRRNRRL